jgi:NAD(P) transhydrogenase subunit alpha
MKIGVLKEISAQEKRVAVVPDLVKKLKQTQGVAVLIEKGAGESTFLTDENYRVAGAELVARQDVLSQADVIFCVAPPSYSDIEQAKSQQIWLGGLASMPEDMLVAAKNKELTLFALEKLPRTTRAQSMDILSSQANLAGYVAVLLAANYYPKMFPMMMTAAGTVKAARLLILGAGVAGLQAIATARRLGAVVEAFDVRAAAKEQVESLGAKFVEVPLTEEEKELAKGQGGYAREMTPEYQAKQAALVAKHVQAADIVITTALIPGKPAPKLLTRVMVEAMKAGSVVIDLAAVAGGNCELTQANQVVHHQGVQIVGETHLLSRVSQDASQLFGRNLLTFFQLICSASGELVINKEDELVRASLLLEKGQVVS